MDGSWLLFDWNLKAVSYYGGNGGNVDQRYGYVCPKCYSSRVQVAAALAFEAVKLERSRRAAGRGE